MISAREPFPERNQNLSERLNKPTRPFGTRIAMTRPPGPRLMRRELASRLTDIRRLARGIA
jgi:hypothetical protein